MDHHDTNWRTCYEQLAPKLVLFARQWARAQADAEDIVQNAFVKFWRHQPDAGPEHYPLLYAAVRTCALDFLRSSDRRTRRENDDRVPILRADEPIFDTTLDQRDTADALEAALLPREPRRGRGRFTGGVHLGLPRDRAIRRRQFPQLAAADHGEPMQR